MRDYIINGVPLRDPVGYKYGLDYTKSELDGDVSRTILGVADFGYNGSLADLDNYFGGSKETLTLNIMADTKDEYNSFFRGFQGLFGKRNLFVTTAPQRSALAAGSGRANRSFGVSSDQLREGLFRQVGSPAVERIDEETARVKWVIENIWGFYRSTVDYTTAAQPVSNGATVALDATTGDSNAPITTGMIRIKGPIAANGYVNVLDVNSPKGVGYTAKTALLGTEYVLIDFLTLKAYKVTTDTWSTTGATDVSAQLTINGEGAFGFEMGHPITASWPAGTQYGYKIVAAGFTSAFGVLGLRGDGDMSEEGTRVPVVAANQLNRTGIGELGLAGSGTLPPVSGGGGTTIEVRLRRSYLS